MEEINAWLETCRNQIKPEPIALPKKRRASLSGKSDDRMKAIISKVIDAERENYYDSGHGKLDRIEGLRKES